MWYQKRSIEMRFDSAGQVLSSKLMNHCIFERAVNRTRKLVASALLTKTKVSIPSTDNVDEVLSSKKKSPTIEALWICPHFPKDDIKSKAGLASHIRLKHKK
jgi:hypothetical protein